MDGRTDGQTDRYIVRYSNGHRHRNVKKETAILTVTSSLNQQELVGLDYKYYTLVAKNVFSHDVGEQA